MKLSKKFITNIMFLFIFSFSVFFVPELICQERNIYYDSTLAKELNADDYGMKKYVMALLKTGSITNVEKSYQDSIFNGHMKNMQILAAEGKLIVAGPFFKNDKYRGIFIFNVETIEDAKKLLETDPAIKSKLLDADLLPWYGSAALQEINKIHNLIEKKKF